MRRFTQLGRWLPISLVLCAISVRFAIAETIPGEIPEMLPPIKIEGPARDIEAGAKPEAAFLGWDDGFFLRSPDKRFSLRITGQVQGDYRAFLDGGDRTDIDAFAVRRARFGLEATLAEFYEFRFLPDFGAGQTRLQDAYMNVRYWDAFQVEGGKFKQPFSYEQLIQDRFTPFMERSLIDQLVPARDVGLMIHGQKLFDNRLDYGIAIANGERDGDTDTNDHKDASARIVLRPFVTWEESPLQYLQVGVAATTGVQNEPINPTTLRTPAGVPFFQFNQGVYADGLRNRFSPEVAYFVGGFGFSAQYFRMDQEMRPAFSGVRSRYVVDVPFDGYYVQSSYLVTGEQRTTYSQAINPNRPFNPRKGSGFGIGALEIVARVSRVRVGEVVFMTGPARLADPMRFSDRATEMTLGFNWYWSKWVRTQFNWEHAWFGRPVRLGSGPGGLFRDHDTVQARLQIVF